MNVLGISAHYHDAAVALVRDGVVVAAVQEERLSRVKNDPSFPIQALASCLELGSVAPGDLDAVAFYEKPLNSLSRVLRSFVAAGPRGARSFPEAVDRSLRHKLWISYEIEKGLRALGHGRPPRTLFAEHHVSHAAAAFYPSPYESACVLTFDGVGEWATSSIGVGRGRHLDLLEELRFPHSIGLLYAAFTSAAGFAVNSGEYKLMGLAPFGEPVYRDQILGQLIDLRDDGSFTIDLSYFDFLAGRHMTNDRFHELLGGPPRRPDEPITQRHCDLARSIQDVTEEIVLRVARHAHALTGLSQVVLGGGVALNCVANGRLQREGPFDDVWVQPAAGDAGSAVGCALWAYHEVLEQPRVVDGSTDGMHGSLLGQAIDVAATADELTAAGRPFRHLADHDAWATEVAILLAAGEVVALARGPMEFGPRALGARSILADPRDAGMQARINGAVKDRESFRPFAPAVLAERAEDWFDFSGSSPHMGFVAPVLGADCEVALASRADDLQERLALVGSPLPAVTHVDGSARLQTVTAASSPDLHAVLVAFERLTGCPVLLNTSFNVRDEPIVASGDDAYRCFMTTGIDQLVLGDCVLAKADQPAWEPAPA